MSGYNNSTLFLYSSLAPVYIHLTVSAIAISVLSSTVNCRCRHTSVTSQAPASSISANSISSGAHSDATHCIVCNSTAFSAIFLQVKTIMFLAVSLSPRYILFQVKGQRHENGEIVFLAVTPPQMVWLCRPQYSSYSKASHCRFSCYDYYYICVFLS